jgi:IS1 family transposase
MDDLWLFVDNKGNKQWVWLAIDADIRELIGCYVRDSLKMALREPSRESAIALWQSSPGAYRQFAKVYTGYWEAYVDVIPSKRHVAVRKDSGLTSYIERLNNTLNAEDFSVGEEDAILFKEARESHRCDLDVHP